MPLFGMFNPMQAMFFDPSSSCAYCAAPRFDASGPWLVDTRFGVSKHSEIAQAEAIAMMP